MQTATADPALWTIRALLNNLDEMRRAVHVRQECPLHRWVDPSMWRWVVEWMPRYLAALARRQRP